MVDFIHISDGLGISIGKSFGQESVYYPFYEFAPSDIVKGYAKNAILPRPDFSNGKLYYIPNIIDDNSGWSTDYPSKINFNNNIKRYSIKINSGFFTNQFFKPATNSLNIENDPLGGNVADFSISVWLKSNRLGSTFIQGASVSSPFGFAVSFLSGQLIVLIDGVVYNYPFPSAALLDNQWRHFCLVRAGSNLKSYIDGVQIFSSAFSSSLINLLSESLLIGQKFGNFTFPNIFDFDSNGFFSGNLTELRMFKFALSDANIQKFANGEDLVDYNENPVKYRTAHFIPSGQSLSLTSSTYYRYGLFYENKISNERLIGVTGEAEYNIFKKVIASAQAIVSGTADIKDISFRYIGSRQPIKVSGESVKQTQIYYVGSGEAYTTELISQLSRATVKRSWKYVASGGVSVKGNSFCYFRTSFNLDFFWKTSTLQVIKKSFSWDTGRTRSYFFRVISKCLDKCPPFEKIDDACDYRITTIIEAFSVEDLCTKLRRFLRFSIHKVERLSAPTTITSSFDLETCTTFEEVEVCNNIVCAEFCFDLDAIINIGFESSLSLLSFYKHDSYATINVAGYSVVSKLPEIIDRYEFTSSLSISLETSSLYKTSGLTQDALKVYEPSGNIIISGESQSISSAYSFVGGVDSYFVDIWPSSAEEIIEDSSTYSNWYLKRPLLDLPFIELPQSAPSVSFLIDQNALTNPQDGYYTRSFIGTTPLKNKPSTTKLILGNFEVGKSFYPLTDAFLLNPFGGNTLGTYDGKDLYRIGRTYTKDINLEEQKIDSIEIYLRKTGINFQVFDEEIILLDGNGNKISENAKKANPWPITVNQQINFVISKYSFKLNQDVDINDLKISLKAKPGTTASSVFAVIHYVFARVIYQEKKGQVIRISGTPIIKSNRWKTKSSGGILIKGQALAKISRKTKLTVLVKVNGSSFINRLIYSDVKVNLTGESIVDTNFKNFIADVNVVMNGEAFVSSSVYNTETKGFVKLNGTAIVSRYKQRYISKGNLKIEGISVIVRNQTSNIRMITSGEASVISSSYFYNNLVRTNLYGSADVKSTFLGEFDVSAGLDADILEPSYLEKDEVFDGEFTVPTATLIRCGCFDLPLTIRHYNNLNKSNKLDLFLNKNNLQYNNKSFLIFNSVNNSWQENYHFKGKSLQYVNVDEFWDIVFEFSCTDSFGGSSVDSNLWRYSVNITQSNIYEDNYTKVVFAFPPDATCFSNNELNFYATIDTKKSLISIDPEITINQLAVYDEIGLFKSKAWKENPDFKIGVSQGRLERFVERIDLQPIFS